MERELIKRFYHRFIHRLSIPFSNMPAGNMITIGYSYQS